ncbi:MAG: ferritin [Candidatus Woesearchaeota archaeon]
MEIKKAMQDAFNAQINKEFGAAYLYLSMAAYFEQRGLSGFAKWMKHQAQEELSHGMKCFTHIVERGGTVKLTAIDAPKQTWKSATDAFTDAYNHEKKVTASISELYTLAQKEGDYSALPLLHWFLEEQIEEEANTKAVLDKLALVDGQPSLYLLDKELGKRKEE